MPSSRYAGALQDLAQLALHGIQPGTERLAAVLQRLGQPESLVPAIHIAGTNGKGSTAAYCAALLMQAARALPGRRLRVGLYTSPHLQRVRERIQFSDETGAALRECSQEELVAALATVQDAAGAAPAITLTFFEVLTAAAFVLFRDAGVELAVIETGLGGRLDATRLCRAEVTVVTSIGIDHQELLGATLAAIAHEKAGIFRPGVPALAACDDASARTELIATAQRLGAPLRFFAPVDHQQKTIATTVPPLSATLAAAVPLPGEHQLRNAALAVAAVQSLPVAEPLRSLLRDPTILRDGLAATRWPGRLERVWPPVTPLGPPVTPPGPLDLPAGVEVWLDAAHNPEGTQALDGWLALQLGGRPLTVLFGVVAGKQVHDMLAPLRRARHVVLTQPASPRGLAAAELHGKLNELPALEGTVEAIQDWLQALRSAAQQTPPGGLLLVYGSIFLIAAVRGWLLGEEVDSLVVQDPGKSPASR